jgi:hypothetical protein
VNDGLARQNTDGGQSVRRDEQAEVITRSATLHRGAALLKHQLSNSCWPSNPSEDFNSAEPLQLKAA